MTWSIAILAAGNSTRFGTEKIFAKLGGRTLIDRTLSSALELKVPVAVVVSPRHLQMRSQLRRSAEIIVNKRADDGISSSIAMAAKWAKEGRCKGLVLALADMPCIRSKSLIKLIQLADRFGMSCCRHTDESPGAPAAFRSELFHELMNLSGDAGARRLLNSAPNEARFDCPLSELIDVDTIADLRQLPRDNIGKSPNS